MNEWIHALSNQKFQVMLMSMAIQIILQTASYLFFLSFNAFMFKWKGQQLVFEVHNKLTLKIKTYSLIVSD